MAKTEWVLSPAILDTHIAILGKTGAGKTMLGRAIAEDLLEHGERVCTLDPAGAHWGLRSNAAGTGPGFPITVMGGHHGDMPLDPRAGAAIAEVVGTTNTPMILDTRRMTVGERTRFFTDFGEALLRCIRGRLHLIIDEAHLFAPKGKVADPASAKMLHAANNLISLGRGVGISAILLTQRPAKLHNDSLTQVETLVAMRVLAPHDRAAIIAWVDEQASEAEAKEMLQSLSTLKAGQGWVWSPLNGILDRRQFRKTHTFDSGRPRPDIEAPVLASIDRPSLEAKLGAIAEEAKANDPDELKARIRELEHRAGGESVLSSGQIEEAREEGWRKGYEAGADFVRQKAQEQITARIEEALGIIQGGVTLLRNGLIGWPGGHLSVPPEPPADGAHSEVRFLDVPGQEAPITLHGPTIPAPVSIGYNVAHHSPKATETKSGTGAELRILRVLADRHPAQLTVSQWATLSKMKRSGGTWGTYVSRLRSAGFIEERDGLVGATGAGRAKIGWRGAKPVNRRELIDDWMRAVGGGPARLLGILVEKYPRVVDRNDLAKLANMEPSGGSFGTYLSRLSGNELVEKIDGKFRASPNLMGAPGDGR